MARTLTSWPANDIAWCSVSISRHISLMIVMFPLRSLFKFRNLLMLRAGVRQVEGKNAISFGLAVMAGKQTDLAGPHQTGRSCCSDMQRHGKLWRQYVASVNNWKFDKEEERQLGGSFLTGHDPFDVSFTPKKETDMSQCTSLLQKWRQWRNDGPHVKGKGKRPARQLNVTVIFLHQIITFHAKQNFWIMPHMKEPYAADEWHNQQHHTRDTEWRTNVILSSRLASEKHEHLISLHLPRPSHVHRRTTANYNFFISSQWRLFWPEFYYVVFT